MEIEEKIQDIKDNPDKHKHKNFHELNSCCMHDGALDLLLIDAHSKYAPIGYNGKPCDVYEGPCSCGAWHFDGEERK